MKLTDVLEYLHASYEDDECEFMKKRHSDTLRRNLQWFKLMESKIVTKIKSNHYEEIEEVMRDLYKGGKSRYNYLKNGIDFINHVRTKTQASEELYECLVMLLTVEQSITEINRELNNRIEFKILDIDSIVIESKKSTAARKATLAKPPAARKKTALRRRPPAVKAPPAF